MEKCNEKSKKVINTALLVFAVTTLANPNVNIFDYLPDFIGYFIIANTLSYYADRAPFFEEARIGFLRLAFVSAAKIPAYFIMVMIRGANTADNDVKSLFAFSFAAVDVILIIIAVRNLFEGIRYLGERGNAPSLITPFPISKNGKRTETVDGLRILTYIFAVAKCAAASLPELLLLTKLVYGGANTPVFNVARLYPYVIIFSVLFVFILGIVFTKRYARFFRAIESEGLIKDAVDGLLDEESKKSLDKKLFVKDITAALTTLAVATFFSVNLRFDNFFSLDLIPGALIAIVALIGLLRLSKRVKVSKIPVIFSIIYAGASALTYVLELRFLNSYSYDELGTMTVAKEAFRPVIFGYSVEFVLFCAFIVGIALLLLRFADEHVGISKDSPRYSKMDAEYNASMRLKIYIWAGTGILCGAANLLDTVFKYFSTSSLISTDTDLLTVTSGLVPWFNLVVFGTAALFICYSLYLFGKLKEDVELKYL